MGDEATGRVRELVLERGTERGRRVRVAATLKGGRYEVLDILADGGMGVLFRARDHRVGGNIALIKGVKYDASMFGFDREAALYHIYAMRQRFKREKNVLMEMGQRGLNATPALIDFFYDANPALEEGFPFGRLRAQEVISVGGAPVVVERDREPYIVMERVVGRSVRELLPTLSEARLLELARAVCRILERLHREREREDGTRLSFVYMDLKPDNLLVDRQGGVTLVDFGAVIPVVDGARRGRGAYTPGFAAPEVRRLSHPAASVDGRADLYSLGAVLFQGLSVGQIDPMTRAAPLENEFPVLEVGLLRPDLHPLTRRVIIQALARDPEERFASARQMGEAIEAALREV